MSNSVLSCQSLAKSFSDGKIKVSVFNELNFKVGSAELVGIIGRSGSGKSTLLHLLGGLEKPTKGSVYWNDVCVNKLSEAKKSRLRNQSLGFIYQFHHLLAEFTALENVCMPLLIRGVSAKASKAKSLDLLNRVGLSHRSHHRIGELSGGERQRVAISRALVGDPQCVLADEPTGNLDIQTANEVFDVMLSLQQSLETSFLIVTHDQQMAKRMQRVLHLDKNQLT
jgi:lipoprotein-releasing system ATP-binding protein